MTFHVDLSRFPTSYKLKIDSRRMIRVIGNKLAVAVRRRIRRGNQAGERSLPRSVTLEKSGTLLRSIKFDAKTQSVRPKGLRGDLGKALRGRNEGLMWVQIHQQKIDPMGVDPQLQAETDKLARKALKRDLRRPGLGIITDFKRARK